MGDQGIVGDLCDVVATLTAIIDRAMPALITLDTGTDRRVYVTPLGAAAAAQRDAVYRERDQVVAALSKVFPSHLARHEGEWDDEWRNIVCIHLPAGQARWHIHDAELPLVAHLKVIEPDDWDGHSTREKYNRLHDLAPGQWYQPKALPPGAGVLDGLAPGPSRPFRVPPPGVYPAQTAPPAESQEGTQP